MPLKSIATPLLLAAVLLAPLSARAAPDFEHMAGLRWCTDRAERRIERLDQQIERRLKLTDQQKSLWERLREGLETTLVSVRNACAGMDREASRTTPQRLADAERVLAAQLDALRSIRPLTDAFYASLDETQKREFDAMTGGRPSSKAR